MPQASPFSSLSLVSSFVARCLRAGAVLAPAVAALVGAPAALNAQTATVAPNWTQQSPVTSPPARSGAAMAYDAATGQVVLFGGSGPTSTLGDTWTYNGTTWTQQSPATSPPVRAFASMVYDAATKQVVLFGGVAGAFLSDTWTYDGTTWTQQNPATSPSSREYALMAYDGATGQVVLFGGIKSGVSYGDTWTYNGTTWTQQSPATSPSARFASTMAYDAATGQVVLFSGANNVNGTVADTWTYNGTTWTQQTPAASPPASTFSQMTYNAATGQVIIFSGSSGTAYTWTYNGTTWTQQSPATSPAGRDAATMAYDAATGQVVLFGGVGGGGNYLTDTWTYQLGAAGLPTSNVGTAAAQTPVYFLIGTSGTLPVLSNSNVLTKGASGLDFTLGTGSTCTGAVTAGQTCTVNVVFTPRFSGQRLGAVNLLDGSGNTLATALISGTGNGPAVTFPGTTTITTTVGSGFRTPENIALDGAGDVYVADTNNLAVEEITTGGSTVTVGSGFGSVYGVAVDGAGNVYAADSNSGIKEIVAVNGATSSSSTVRTLSSSFNRPSGVAVDAAGNVYVAETYNNAVKEIVAVNGQIPSNPTINTLGSGFSIPLEVAVDAAGNVYVADTGNNAVKEIVAVGGVTSSSSTVTTLGSGFSSPRGVSVDGAGDVYVADTGNNSVKEIAAVGGSIPASNPTILTLASGLNGPAGVYVVGSGNVYVADTGSNLVKRLALTTPPTLNFPNTAVGSTSASQTVTLQNIGNAALTFPVPSTGQNPSQSNYFVLGNSSTCITLTNASSNSVSLAAGASCMEAISYTPTVSGAVTGNLIFTDSSLNATYATQTVVETGTTTSTLNVSVVGQNVPQGTSSITLEFTVGYGGNIAPTGTPTLTVNGANVTGVTCKIKAGHNNCTATDNPSSLTPGAYTITATQPSDSSYSTTSANGILTITGSGTSQIARPVEVPAPLAAAPTAPFAGIAPRASAPAVLLAAPIMNLNSSSDIYGDNPSQKPEDSKPQP